MPNTSYNLPGGTKLTIEMPSITNGIPSPETWTREGWIECCGVSARELMDSGIAVDVRFRRFSTDIYEVKIVEEVTDAARKQELMDQVTEYYNRNTIRYGTMEYNVDTHAVNYNSVDTRIFNGAFTGNMVY